VNKDAASKTDNASHKLVIREADLKSDAEIRTAAEKTLSPHGHCFMHGGSDRPLSILSATGAADWKSDAEIRTAAENTFSPHGHCFMHGGSNRPLSILSATGADSMGPRSDLMQWHWQVPRSLPRMPTNLHNSLPS